MPRSPLTNEHLQHLARLGAKARLQELRAEMDGILKAFPDLPGVSRGPRSAAQPASTRSAARNKSHWSAAKRKEVSARMKKYWADRKKSEAAKSK